MQKNHYSLLIKVFNLIFVFVLGLSLGIGTKIIFAAEDELKVGSILNMQKHWIYNLPTDENPQGDGYVATKKYVDDRVDSIGTSGAAYRVTKYQSDGTGLTESTIYDNGAAVGIGTTAPSQRLEVYPGTDARAIIGYAAVGNVGHSGYAGFAHKSQATASNYAFLQSSSGDTFVNAASGKNIYFRINNSTEAYLSTGGL